MESSSLRLPYQWRGERNDTVKIILKAFQWYIHPEAHPTPHHHNCMGRILKLFLLESVDIGYF